MLIMLYQMLKKRFLMKSSLHSSFETLRIS